MKKFMRIALVFALAGAALMYTGCTKDYSGDISDLNKKVSEQASALSALQTQVAAAQSSASEALSSAQNALKEAQAAAKAAADANNDAEVAALTTKIATIEGNIADLQAKVEALNGLEEKLNEVADQLKKDVDAKVDAALEEIQAELDKALAQVEGNFSVDAIIAQTATYASAKWAPETSKEGKANLAKLTKVFPELAELKKDDVVETFGHLNFIVNPSSVVLDDTYKFALVGADGKDSRVVLGNPTPGININGIEPETKAGLTVWNVEVQSPAYEEDGKTIKEEVKNLALVVENADGVYAQTRFAYSVKNNSNNSNNFSITGNDFSFKFDDTKSENSFNAIKLVNTTPNVATPEALFYVYGDLYEDYFIIEADPADVEKFGIKIEGSKISFTETPEPTKENHPHTIDFFITAVSVDGTTDYRNNNSHKATLNLSYTASVAPNAELKDQTVTLGYTAKNGHNVAVKYDFADFEFSAAEKKAVYEALKNANITITDSKNPDGYGEFVDGTINLYNANGNEPSVYSDAVAFGFNVKSTAAVPGTYTVVINAGDVFCGKGELTIQNPEACPVKLIDALCKDGVLQIVGATRDADGAITGYIKYSLENALVYDSNEAGIYTGSFVDEDKANDDESWVEMPANTTFKVAAKKANLYTPRNFSVNFKWFGNENNKGTFEFKAQAVSPIYAEGGKDAVVVANQTIYIGGEGAAKGTPTSFDVNKIVTSAKYVAGDNVGDSYKVFNTWKTNQTTPGTPAKYTYYEKVTNGYNPPSFSVAGDVQAAKEAYKNAFGETVVNSQYVLNCETGLPIEFVDFDIETIKVFNSTVKTSDYTALQAYLKGETVDPLYLSTSMFDKLAKTWAKYHDKNGKELKADVNLQFYDYTTGNIVAKKIKVFTTFAAEYNNFVEGATANYVLYTKVPEHADMLDKWQNGDDDDDVAVALFNTYGDLAKKLEEKAGEPTAADDINNGDAADEIKTVKVAFEDPTYAVKFVEKTEFNDPYTTRAEETVSIAPDAKFEAGLNSVTLKAYIEIADNWGMTMKIPFTVTVKTATK